MNRVEAGIRRVLNFIKENEDWLSFGLGLVSLVVLITIGGYYVWKKVNFSGITQPVNVSVEEETMVSPTPTPGYYVVKRGDYLWKIAVEYYNDGYKWVEIAKVNNLKNPDLLFAGQKLIMPTITPAPSPAFEQDLKSDLSQDGEQEVVYEVKKGDMLWFLTQKFYGDPYLYVKVAKYNKISDPNIIEVGQKIKFPTKRVLDGM